MMPYATGSSTTLILLFISLNTTAQAMCSSGEEVFACPKPLFSVPWQDACGIPARIGFADVRNHLATKQLIKFMGSDLFVYHGFVECHLEGKWVKATPAFNLELCRKHHVPPLEFNGREDSLFQAYNLQNQRFMEYIHFHGVYADIPVEQIVAAWEKAYGMDRVRNWIRLLKEGNDRSLSDFAKEEVLND